MKNYVCGHCKVPCVQILLDSCYRSFSYLPDLLTMVDQKYKITENLYLSHLRQ